MNTFKDWICSLSRSLLSARPLSNNDDFFGEGLRDAEFGSRVSDSTSRDNLSAHLSTDMSSHYSIDNQVNEVPSTPQPVPVEDSHLPHYLADGHKGRPLAKIDALQMKFLRLVSRLGLSTENLVVAKVLYRLRLACLIRAGESDMKAAGFKNDKAIAIAAEQEVCDQSDLDISLKILLLGKTGVGKSATINSIFDQTKAVTDAFQPATDRIHEVAGTVCGIKITVIDTPGLLPSCSNHQRQNRKILHSVRSFIRKSPPDVVLYFERLDVINMGYSDFPVLRLITDVLGSAIWYNTILVMTHSSSALPEGPDGYEVSYEAFITRRTNLVQYYINQTVDDPRLDNQVLLVENHPLCERNITGEKVLPNDQVWRSQFLLLCISTKVLGDANALLKFHDSFQSRQNQTRLPSLPHLLSSLLRSRSSDSEYDMDGILAMDDEDVYDELPAIRILNKAEFEKLTKAQKNDYLEELDYRETLYLKKQLKEELRTRRENIFSKDEVSTDYDNYEAGEPPGAAPMLDRDIPLSFDPDCPVYRYRCLPSNDQWFLRGTLDSQGWDHDVGLDGVYLEVSEDIRKNLHTSIVGQMSKDKRDFNLQAECSATYRDLKGPSVYTGIDIQTSGRDLVCTIRGDTKLRNLEYNVTSCGLSVTSFGNKYFIGSKIEDSVLIGKRLKLDLNAGRMGGYGQVAYGGSIEATVKGKDFPVRNDKLSLAMSATSLNKDWIFGGSIQADFRPFCGGKMSVNVNLNSRKMGLVCVKTSGSEHIEIAFIVLIPIVRALIKRKSTDGHSPLSESRKEDLY